MHIYENYAVMVLSPAVNLRRNFDKVRIMCENHGSDESGPSQLNFIGYPDVCSSYAVDASTPRRRNPSAMAAIRFGS